MSRISPPPAKVSPAEVTKVRTSARLPVAPKSDSSPMKQKGDGTKVTAARISPIKNNHTAAKVNQSPSSNGVPLSPDMTSPKRGVKAARIHPCTPQNHGSQQLMFTPPPKSLKFSHDNHVRTFDLEESPVAVAYKALQPQLHARDLTKQDFEAQLCRFNIPNKGSRDALNRKIEAQWKDMIAKELGELGLDTHGTREELGDRLALFKSIAAKAEVRYAARDIPAVLDVHTLKAELTRRRGSTEGDIHVLQERLEHAVAEESERFFSKDDGYAYGRKQLSLPEFLHSLPHRDLGSVLTNRNEPTPRKRREREEMVYGILFDDMSQELEEAYIDVLSRELRKRRLPTEGESALELFRRLDACTKNVPVL